MTESSNASRKTAIPGIATTSNALSTIDTAAHPNASPTTTTPGTATHPNASPTTATPGTATHPDASPTTATPGTTTHPDASPATATPGTTTHPDASPTTATLGTTTHPDASPTTATLGTTTDPEASPATATLGTTTDPEASPATATLGTTTDPEASPTNTTPDTATDPEASPTNTTLGTTTHPEASPTTATPGTATHPDASPTTTTPGTATHPDASPIPPNIPVISTLLPPDSTIGLIGGGQLARMLAIAAAELGFRTVVFCPEADCPAAQTANEHIVAAYNDTSALDRFISLCDVVTYEFENLSLQTVQHVEKSKNVYPSSQALEITQDRLFEKQFLQKQGIRTASWHAVDNYASLLSALSALGNRGLLKTRRFGYDGKNQIMLNHPDEQTLDKALTTFRNQPLILEEIVPFLSEISVLSARTQQGEHIFYDCPENQHKNGILHKSFVPSHVSLDVQKAAQEISLTVMDALNYVGVLCIEFFVLIDGSLLVNELAPRVHNSGHWTQKACITSQFEQHIRTICGLPLGSTYRHSNCQMTNLLGNSLSDFKYFLKQKHTSVHLYGKRSVQPLRKMGHVIQLTGPATKS